LEGPKWFAFAAVANGVIFVASGVTQQTTGFSAPSMDLEHDSWPPVHGLDGCARVVHLARSKEAI
jgi:hypothetical protein